MTMLIGQQSEADIGLEFLPRDAMHKRGMPSCGVCPSVRPSVRLVFPSVMFVRYIEIRNVFGT